MLVIIVDRDDDYIFLKEVYVVASTVSPPGHLANEVGRKYVKLVLLLSKLIV